MKSGCGQPDPLKLDPMNNSKYRLEKIEVTGIVQGVGFRPFVHSLANVHHLCGYVVNNPNGVIIEAEGKPDDIETFVSELKGRPPALSRIYDIRREVLKTDRASRLYDSFAIHRSEQGGRPATLISPDVCVCEDCLRELFDPNDRRYLYPFINCTNCGPRFTIIQKLPYDRPFTTMQSFFMCRACKREYEDPADRRFHAQPNACPICGPQLELLDGDGEAVPGDPLLISIELLRSGKIVALKSLGGFHLAVDATNEEAVKRLRERKHREEKPLALMVANMETVRSIAKLSKIEEEIVNARERPILLGHRRRDMPESLRIADSVAPDNPYLGVMLPYTPLHYLLFFHPRLGGDYANDKPLFAALVMTSGNISEEPICKDNGEALHNLSGIADVFLVHNRDIHVRGDDSVISVVNEKANYIRRSRGFAPAPLFLQTPVPQILAFGAQLKNALCLTDGNRAFMSQYIGDLENVPTLGFFKEAVSHFTQIFDLNPKIFAYDLHPEYMSTRYFMELVNNLEDDDFGAVGVQHHHAHIVSVLAEHRFTAPVIGFSMDGTGYGLDGAVWGGEVLICDAATFHRFAHLDYLPLPGGTAAIREPWRMAFSYLRSAFGEGWKSLNLKCLRKASAAQLELLNQACASGINCPQTSSLGRLFDAVASILDIKHYSSYEGQAAMMVEMSATEENATLDLPYSIREVPPESSQGYPVLWGSLAKRAPELEVGLREGLILDYIPTVRSLVDGIEQGKSRFELAAAFHNTLLDSFLEIARRARDQTGINEVALSGGCWQNRILSARFQELLEDNGFKVMTNHHVPVNDGGVALGQALVAAAIALEKD
jgi:hydrogenase maturation protein HypF